MTTPTIETTSTGGIAIAYDYSPYYERIATSLESIATDVHSVVTSGINVTNRYDWVNAIYAYDCIISQGNALTTSSNTASITSLISAVNDITNNFPKFK